MDEQDPRREPDAQGAPVRRFRDPACNGGFAGLPDVVESAYRSLVAGYIACEQTYFGGTEAIASEQEQKK